MTSFMLRLTILCYAAGTVLYIFSLIQRRVLPARYATWALMGALIVHSGLIIILWMERGYLPLVSRADVLSFFAWSLTGCFLLFQFHTKTRVLGLSIAPVSLVLILLASPGLSKEGFVLPLFKTSLIYLHVGMCILGEALFSGSSSERCISNPGRAAKKQVGDATHPLPPPLIDLDRINDRALTWGLVSLTIGVYRWSFGRAGNWAGTWHLDSKVLWSWGVWILLAILVHQRLAIGWRGRRPAIYTLVFALLLIGTWLIQTYFFPSLHRF